jgi:CRISPR type III-B/RAMP module RAMP protein Cmr6
MAIQVLPDSTQKILDDVRKKLPVHPGLELTKFVPWIEKDHGRKVEPGRGEAFAHVIASLSRAKELAAKWRERRRGWLERLGERALRFELETLSPCVLWLAAPTALELGFCLHHTYGVPYLPGSGLKGLARRQSLFENGGTDQQPDTETLRLFGEGGDAGRAGLIDFLDGIPLDPACLELDVMSPHHPDYYAGRNAIPHDCEDPVPITFLRIRVGARFELALLAGANGSPDDFARAQRVLTAGLADLGLGAKTSSGYGLFGRPQQMESKEQGGSTKTALTSEREMVGVVKSFDAKQIVLVDRDGNELRLDRKDLETRFGVSSGRWNQYRKEGQRFRILIKGERVDSFAPVKS